MSKRAKELWQYLCNVISWLLHDPNQPLIREKRDRNGQMYWEVYDPTTGHHVICDSEQEVCAWIEQHWFRDRR